MFRQIGDVQEISKPVMERRGDQIQESIGSESEGEDSDMLHEDSNCRNGLVSEKVITPKAFSPTNKEKTAMNIDDIKDLKNLFKCGQVRVVKVKKLKQNELTASSVTNEEKTSTNVGNNGLLINPLHPCKTISEMQKSINKERGTYMKPKMLAKSTSIIYRPTKIINAAHKQEPERKAKISRKRKLSKSSFNDSKANEEENKSIADENEEISKFKFPAMKFLGMQSIALSKQNHLCPICRKEFSKPIEIRQHAYEHKILHKYLFECPKVPRNPRFFVNPRQSDTIFNRVEILHRCVFCKEEFPTERFQDHIAKHVEEGQFSCNKCNRIFRKLSHLNAHVTLTHLGELPYQCDVCEKQFSSTRTYNSHLLIHQKRPNEFPFKCNICDKTFPIKFYWRRHTLLHAQHKRYMTKCRTIKCYTHDNKVLCELCGAVVLNIKQHMITHTPKQDPLECEICQKKLATKSTLIKHIRVHTGERPYPCKYCGKRFKVLNNKCVHERIHVGIKKHVCPVCGKGFLEKSYMVKHLRGVHKQGSNFTFEKGKPGRPHSKSI